jgi:hypothetical protein
MTSSRTKHNDLGGRRSKPTEFSRLLTIQSCPAKPAVKRGVMYAGSATIFPYQDTSLRRLLTCLQVLNMHPQLTISLVCAETLPDRVIRHHQFSNQNFCRTGIHQCAPFVASSGTANSFKVSKSTFLNALSSVALNCTFGTASFAIFPSLYA